MQAMSETSKRQDNFTRIAIVRLGGLGDVVNTLPALDAVRTRWPDARISWLVESQWLDILPAPPRLDEIIAIPKKEWLAKLKNPADLFTLPAEVTALARELRARRFDLAIDFHGNMRSGVVTALTNARVRVGFAAGYCKEWNYLFTNERHAVGGGRIHRIDRALALCRAIGAEPAGDTPKLDLPDEAREFARSVFAERELGTRTVAAIHPGTSAFGSYKRWPAERFRELIQMLDSRGVVSFITWGPGEADLAIEAAAGTGAVVSPPTKSALQLAALLKECDVFIGADTGPGLVAAAVGTPTVSIFGPKDPVIYAPRHPRARVVETPMDCRPCKKRECNDPKCILHITTRHVAEAAFAVLAEMENN